jgi:type IV pilus assembly protein PilE
MTLIELVIVVAVIGILVTTAVPSYQAYMLRVHRTEAIRMLLQASMCQEKIYASRGSYDTTKCQPGSEYGRYQITYSAEETVGRRYIASATPVGVQRTDQCGSLSLDQNGTRRISSAKANVTKCWGGR